MEGKAEVAMKNQKQDQKVRRFDRLFVFVLLFVLVILMTYHLGVLPALLISQLVCLVSMSVWLFFLH